MLKRSEVAVCSSWRRCTLTALVFVVLAANAAVADASSAAQPRIAGGDPTGRAAFPYVASLFNDELSVFCGGSLIAPDRVLTAAHCLPYFKVGDRVDIGGLPPSDIPSILRVAQDPRWTALVDGGRSPDSVLPFDAAILQLDAPVTTVAPIRLAQPVDAALWGPGALLTAVGISSVNTGEVIRSARAVARADGDCTALLTALGQEQGFVPDAMLCTTDADSAAPFRYACLGDTGSPLVALLPDSTLVQVGIDERGAACGVHNLGPETYAEAAAIAGFALSPAPVFQPELRDGPTITGTLKVGRKVRCIAHFKDPQPDKVKHAFYVVRNGSASFLVSSRSYRIPRKMRGRRLNCSVLAHSAGGETSTFGAPTKRVR